MINSDGVSTAISFITELATNSRKKSEQVRSAINGRSGLLDHFQ